jgi:hypothetical protein
VSDSQGNFTFTLPCFVGSFTLLTSALAMLGITGALWPPPEARP